MQPQREYSMPASSGDECNSDRDSDSDDQSITCPYIIIREFPPRYTVCRCSTRTWRWWFLISGTGIEDLSRIESSERKRKDRTRKRDRQRDRQAGTAIDQTQTRECSLISRETTRREGRTDRQAAEEKKIKIDKLSVCLSLCLC
jgi:hypothetical protein